MADLRPFRGLRYNQEVVGDLAPIVCPPFDTIPEELQKTLYQSSPFNVVRLEAGQILPTDTLHQNRYTRAASLLDGWIEKGVLVREPAPAFYLVQHNFRLKGVGFSRLELMACVRLEEYSRRVVLPHEHTRDADKQDRLALMEACHVNVSPIMCLYQDEGHRLSGVFQETQSGKPLMDFEDAAGQGYRVWRIGGERDIREVREALASRSLYIADGHHRYETALAFRDGESDSMESPDAAPNFVMMGLIDFGDPGLNVLPYHRVLGGVDADTLAGVKERLDQLFDSELLSMGNTTLDKFLSEIELRGQQRLVMGLLDPGVSVEEESLQLLTLRPGTQLGTAGPLAESEAWTLEEQVLRPVLGSALGQHLEYIHDGEEAAKTLRTGKYQLGFFLKPFPLDLFKRIIDGGHRLPPKSTFFYPKLSTGLVINLLEGSL